MADGVPNALDSAFDIVLVKGYQKMTPDEKKTLRALMIQKIDDSKRSQIHLKESSKAVAPDNAIGRITRMDAIQSKNMNEALLRRAEEQEEKLNQALSKIDETDFGTCLKCKKTILFERLIAIPEAKFCVPCAEKL